MRQNLDTYNTLGKPSEGVLYKDKKSKFYGYAYPVQDEDKIKDILARLKKLHPTANHICYAWQLGIENPQYRANDDGEPNNSAGLPIYGQIKSLELSNVLIAVVRIFGGTKLGVGKLINAYRTAAQMALAAAPIEERLLKDEFLLVFPYADLDKIMRIIKQRHLDIISQQMDMNCSIGVAVRRKESIALQEQLRGLKNVQTKRVG